MSKLEQAARQLIENWFTPDRPFTSDDLNALREALAEQDTISKLRGAFFDCLKDATVIPAEQAEQEPVEWKHDCAALCANDVELWIDNCPHCGKPRTAAPVRTKDLTDDEIDDVRDKTWCLKNSLREYARAVIAKDREKNRG